LRPLPAADLEEADVLAIKESLPKAKRKAFHAAVDLQQGKC